MSREKRKRRSAKANLNYPGAAPKHKLKSGRTGFARAKKNHSPKNAGLNSARKLFENRSVDGLLSAYKVRDDDLA